MSAPVKKAGKRSSAKKADQREGIVRSVTLSRNCDGTLCMPRFHECLPTGIYKDKLKEFLDLDILFCKLRYNALINSKVDNAMKLGNTKPESLSYDDCRLNLGWDVDDTKDGQNLSLFRIVALLIAVRYTMMHHDSCEEVSAPAFVFTDLHGQHSDLLRWLMLIGGPEQQQVYNYVICGDTVDRGPSQIETVALLLYYKLRYPTRFFFLRGNHEDFEMHEHYGFLDECRKRCKFDVSPGHPMYKYEEKLYYLFIGVFDWLPSALIIDKKIFCVHGGLSPMFTTCPVCHAGESRNRITDICEMPNHVSPAQSSDKLIELINTKIKNPCEIGTAYLKSAEQMRTELPKKTQDNYCFTMSDMLWSDPAPIKGGFGPSNAKYGASKGWNFNNDRKIAYIFGADVIEKFLNCWQVNLVIRGHDVRMEGYEWHSKKHLITAFSAPGYVNKGNKGCICMVSLNNMGEKRKLRIDPIVLNRVSAAKSG